MTQFFTDRAALGLEDHLGLGTRTGLFTEVHRLNVAQDEFPEAEQQD